MYVAFVELDVFSGLSVFYPYTSTSAPTYPLPPPTTLLGAVAYPYMRQYHVEDIEDASAAVKLLNEIIYATAGCEGYVITRDVERVYQAIYQRKERWKEEFKDLWYTIAVRGVVRYLDDKLYAVYLSKNPDVLEYAYGITRIGRKEGVVVVKSVTISELNDVLVHGGYNTSFETIFYTPSSIVECEDATAVKIRMHKLAEANFKHTTKLEVEEYYVPRGFTKMKCRLLSNGALISVKDLYIAIPKQVMMQLKG
ncbi:MAG: type I-A CRISPR-associated protein Cas5a [Desulfurococcaceae archaeon]